MQCFSLNRPSVSVLFGCLCHFLHFKNVLLLPFTQVKSQIDQLEKGSLRESCKRTAVSDYAILAQKWLEIAEPNMISSIILPYIGFMAVAVGVSDVGEVTG